MMSSTAKVDSVNGLDPPLSPLKQLKGCTLFSGVDLEPLRHILERCRVIELDAESELIRLGVEDHKLYIVLEGSLGIHVEGPGDEPICVVGPGDSVGEIAALDGKPRCAAVVTRDYSRVLAIEADDFWALIGGSHQLSINLLHVLSERLRGNNAKIVDTRRLGEQYRRHASTDPLTGLYNRRGLSEIGERLLRRLAIKQEPLSLLMMDVDHFKRFNDEHGHQAGDFALFAVAQVLKASLRPTDFVARYGGEEFTILLPETPLGGAIVAAERVREAIEAASLEMPDGRKLPPITASLGAATLGEGQTLTSLIEVADEALYRAKHAGRNRVGAASP